MPAPLSPAPARIGLVTATALVVANIIGTGVFTSVGFQVAALGSPFAVMSLWLVGGLLAFCGAISYGELAAALPRSGGEYHFLSRIYHPAAGFCAGWISAVVGFAAPVALSAMAFASYLRGIYPGLNPALVSIALVWAVTLAHLGGIRAGGVFHNIFTLVKIGVILVFITAGFFFAPGQAASLAPAPGDFSLLLTGPYAVSLIYVMYAYSGWNASAYISGEIRSPERNVPLSLLLGTLIVCVLYLLLNAVFLRAAPAEELAGQIEAGLIAGRHIFGENGARLVTLFICLGLVSSVSSMTWVGPRVTMAMGEDLPALRILAPRTTGGVPARALLLQSGFVTLLLLTSTFEAVLIYAQTALILCSALTVAGVIVLRLREPRLARPCRSWAYPVPQLLFLAFAIFMMAHSLLQHPVESLAGLATTLAGLPLYFLARRARLN